MESNQDTQTKETLPGDLLDGVVGLFGSRIELLCDGELILGATVSQRPSTHSEMVGCLKGLIKMLESPAVPYSEEPNAK